MDVDGIFCNFLVKISYFALFDAVLTLLTRESLVRALQSPRSSSLKSLRSPFMSAIPDGISESEFYGFHLLF